MIIALLFLVIAVLLLVITMLAASLRDLRFRLKIGIPRNRRKLLITWCYNIAGCVSKVSVHSPDGEKGIMATQLAYHLGQMATELGKAELLEKNVDQLLKHPIFKRPACPNLLNIVSKIRRER